MSGEVSAYLALRPITPADRELLYRIYASTRHRGAGGNRLG